ncbi:MAG: WD40 repeat domain-containing protein [Clostridiales bacterium]|nr:WD40 repeat domain-containing protein [Clostridiales bacterium]
MTKRRKQKHGATRFFALFLTALVILSAILLVLYRDKISEALSADGGASEYFLDTEPFTYETGSKQIFALFGDRIAVSSSTGLQLLDSSGETIVRQVFSMTNPALALTDSSCAFFDAGGKSFRVFKDGECFELDRQYPIISVSAGKGGYYAVAEQESGYKGSVTVLDEGLEPVYKWYSGTGYILDAAVSPDGNFLGVLCLESQGSILRMFKLDSEDEYALTDLGTELFFKLKFFKNGNICALSQNSLRFFDSGGKELSSHSFAGDYLSGYEMTEEVCALSLSRYMSGNDVYLLSFSPDGSLLATVSLSGEPLSLSSQKQKLVVLCPDEIMVLSRDGKVLENGHVIPGSRAAVMTARGNIYLLSSRYAEKYEPE